MEKNYISFKSFVSCRYIICSMAMYFYSVCRFVMNFKLRIKYLYLVDKKKVNSCNMIMSTSELLMSMIGTMSREGSLKPSAFKFYFL